MFCDLNKTRPDRATNPDMLSRSAVRVTMRAMQLEKKAVEIEKQAMEEKATLAKQELEKILSFLNGTVLRDTPSGFSETDESIESSYSSEEVEELVEELVEEPVTISAESPVMPMKKLSEIKVVFSQAALDATKRAAEAQEAALLQDLEAYENNGVPISQSAVDAMRRAKKREDEERVKILDCSNDWQWPSLEADNIPSSVC
jgi:hypothetical protein